MLMVVFGAGASYDSIPSRPPGVYPTHTLPSRLPLANELFDDRPLFREAITRFPQCQAVIPYLQRLPDGVSLERVLEGLQREANEYPQRNQQLAAIRFYLQYLIWRCERDWGSEAGGV